MTHQTNDREIAVVEIQVALDLLRRAVGFIDTDLQEASRLLNDVANLAGRAAFRLVHPMEE